jgi:hypothetical protein
VDNMSELFKAFKPTPATLNVVFLSVMAGDGGNPFLAKRKDGAGQCAWRRSGCGKAWSYGEPGLVDHNGPDCTATGCKALAQALFEVVAAAAHANCCLHLVLAGCQSLRVSVKPLLRRIRAAREEDETLAFLPNSPRALEVLTPARLADVGYVATNDNIPGTVALPMLALYHRYASVGEGGLELYMHMLKEHVRADLQRYGDAGIIDPSMEGVRTLPQDMLVSSNLGEETFGPA